MLALQRFDEALQTVHEVQARKLDSFVIRNALYALAFLKMDSQAMTQQMQWFAGKPEENAGLSLVSDTEAYAGHLGKARELTKQSVDSSVVSDLLGASGLRILRALAAGETEAKRLAALGDDRLKCTEEQLLDALTGSAQPMHREMLALQLERLQLIDTQIDKLNHLIAQAMKPHQEAVMRLAEGPGLGVDSAQQIIAEVGAQAGTFSSAAELTSWVGTCPGKDESAEPNHRSRSAKGNKYPRRVLSQAAHAAVKKRGSYFQALFRRLLPRLGYQSAIWAIAHRLCRVVWKILHEGVRFIEKGREPDAQAKKKRARILVQALRRLGYDVAITATHLGTQNATQA